MTGFLAPGSPLWTLLSVALGGVIGAGTTYWTEWLRARREDRRADKELLRDVLLHALRFRRLAYEAGHPGTPEQRADRLALLAEAGHALSDRIIEAEAFGPIGIGNIAGLAFEETERLHAVVRTGDPDQISPVTLEVHRRTLYLVDAIRQKLELPPRYPKGTVNPDARSRP
ncbi:hypothetical protein [Cellulomonas sp. S1-8]|uniref:hypothetical protein n=1 Tax=Cellulomonas sp. S1-8 TaxID=2904790 RepID=UPI00224449B2|nr:hypothetical protein [Cellulomonas sp. S1-8]UZN03301.1 hypothetical protein OKX07_19990 [Cellulomonas sp. S1-8]